MSQVSGRQDLRVAAEPAILVHVRLPNRMASGEDRPEEADPFAELRALAETAGASIVGLLEQGRQAPRPSTYLGKGKVDELAAMVKELGARVVIFDNDLAPNQIRDLEKAVECKVIDRSELILDIFAGRASTRQAKLQVEIAQLEYTAPRLRAMWSHLGQVTGGAPVGVGTRGPGETQLETDRRLVQRRISQLKRELAEVLARKQREVQDRRLDHFTVGIVGYTNAGKSTLFNALTAGGAFANNQLFATLGTRVEQWNLGGGNTAILSDTVGFIRDLPHHLVASFRSTLEETVHAHLLLVVVDAADPAVESQRATVESVLEEIGADRQPRLLVFNKIDAIPEADAARLMAADPEAIPISARTGEGIELLRALVLSHMRGAVREVRIEIPLSDAKTIDFIEKRCEVISRTYPEAVEAGVAEVAAPVDAGHDDLPAAPVDVADPSAADASPEGAGGRAGPRVELLVRLGRRQLDQLLARGASILIDGAAPERALEAWRGLEPARTRRVRPHERHELMDDRARANDA